MNKMNNLKKNIKRNKNTLVFSSILVILLVALVSMPNIIAPAGFQTTFMGFRSTEGGGGAITTIWTTGNLGNTWDEGEWVPYQAVLDNIQVDYPLLAGMPDIEI